MKQRLIDAEKLKTNLLAKGFYPAIVARELEHMPADSTQEVDPEESRSKTEKHEI